MFLILLLFPPNTLNLFVAQLIYKDVNPIKKFPNLQFLALKVFWFYHTIIFQKKEIFIMYKDYFLSFFVIKYVKKSNLPIIST